MLTPRRLFQFVSTTVILTILFSGIPSAFASTQGNVNATPPIFGAIWYVANTGSDANSCTSADSPCETINGALAKAAVLDTIEVAVGTYTGTGTEVVKIDKNIILSGGWDAAFTEQSSRSIIDGQEVRDGVYVNSESYTVIERFTIRNGGLGIRNYSHDLELDDSLVTRNAGGGIFNNDGDMVINNTLITENSSYTFAAGIWSSGSVTLNNSTVSRNTLHGGHNSGGIYSNGLLYLSNSTVTRNTGGDGEGIYMLWGSTILDGSTISGNQSYGITVHIGTLRMHNSILAKNGNAGDCRIDDPRGTITSEGYNLIGNSSGCPITPATGDLVDVDPKLGQLIGFPGYMPLAADSPAIDTGDPESCLDTDERGVIRPVGGRCDIGAYEYTIPGSFAQLVIQDGDEQKTGPNMAFAHPLAVAALDSQGSPVSGVSVTFTAPASGASGTFADTQDQSTTSMTGMNGIAIASLLTANSLVGVYSVAAFASGAEAVYFNLQNKAWFVATSGSDSNSCSTPDSPCGTINGAIGKAATDDIVRVAVGTYTGTGEEVVLIDKNITLSGGWNAGFTEQSGTSTIDGEGARRGITIPYSYPTLIVTTTVERFTIQNGFGGSFGGGISKSWGSLTLNDSKVINNVSTWMGGGIYSSGTLTINNTIISGNTAGQVGYNGGGGGAGIRHYQETLTLNNSTISNNTLLGSFEGSGINANGTMLINNSTISGNMGSDGVGISTSFGTLILKNSTISFNQWYGILNRHTDVNLQNTIIAMNGAGRDCYNETGYDGTFTSHGYNLIGNSFTCTLTPTTGDQLGSDAHPIDPLLGPLQDNGGLTPTHALMVGSPAIDAGNPAIPGSAEAACLATDQRGVTRPRGDGCDIGAYELKGPIEVSIHGNEINSYLLASGESKRISLLKINSGPVQIVDARGTPLIASERVIYKVKGVNTSFTEMMALPNTQLDSTYWLPWYNNGDLDTQLRFGNVSGSPAQVHVYIGTDEMQASPFTLEAGESTRVSFAGINNGPVKIESTHGVPIVAAERVIYKVNKVQTSFSEMMALPNGQLDTTYWLPWYNNVDLDTQLRFGNVSANPATVHVFIGTDEMTGSPFTLQPGESTRKSFTGINNGPVKIESDENIVAAERVIYKVNGTQTSFTEMMALPNSQLNSTYWLPWYNNVDLDTQLRIGNVSGLTATVHVFIGGAEVTPVSGITLLTGASTRVSYTAVNNGPVRIVSDHGMPIVAAERVIYKVNNINTSFSEMMGLPNTQLDSIYWLPWYNNVDLDTQLRIGVP